MQFFKHKKCIHGFEPIGWKIKKWFNKNVKKIFFFGIFEMNLKKIHNKNSQNEFLGLKIFN